MAAAQGICDKAAARWDLSRVALAHRTGTCAVGEPSVMIAASSPHRRDALEVRSALSRLLCRRPRGCQHPVAAVLVTCMTLCEQWAPTTVLGQSLLMA